MKNRGWTLIATGVGVAALGAWLVAATGNPPASAGSDGQHHRTTCGDLRDGKGAGSALSALPGKPVTEGQVATIQPISVTWRVCYDIGAQKIWLASSPGWCLAAYNGNAHWEGCGGIHDERWTEKPQSGGGFEIRDTINNVNLDACASDGPGSQVITIGRQGCSTYHRTWLFSQANRAA
jgi:hypothetical protein